MVVIGVDIAGRPYEVRIGEGLLGDLVAQCGNRLRKQRVPIVTDANVHAALGETVARVLVDAGFEPRWKVLPAGESTKSWECLAEVVEWLLAEEVERKDHVLALGGGVIGDLTGFAASVLKRGCNFIQLPTTLLSQVDSSVGGKTAINTAAGKNLVGAFHQPSLVLVDPLTLSSLPAREMGAGYAEVVKYGLLGDADFFSWCESNGPAVLTRDAAALQHAIAVSVKAKAAIVAQDEFETTGARALLNLGHTFGHALEAETGFSGRLLHGEAVALGMVLAARYSARLGMIAAADAERVAAHFRKVGMKSALGELGLNVPGRVLVSHMLHDKKMDSGTLPFVLLRRIGEACLARDVVLDDVALFLDGELTRR